MSEPTVTAIIERLTRLSESDVPSVDIEDEVYDRAADLAHYRVLIVADVLTTAARGALLAADAYFAASYGVPVHIAFPVRTTVSALECALRESTNDALARLFFAPIAEVLARASLDVGTAFVSARTETPSPHGADVLDVEVIATAVEPTHASPAPIARPLADLASAARSIANIIAEFGNAAATMTEPINRLQTALRAFERWSLAPGDEHVDDFNARVVRLLSAPKSEALALLNSGRVVRYLRSRASEGWSMVGQTGAQQKWMYFPRRVSFSAWDDNDTSETMMLTYVRIIAACEERDEWLVIADLLSPTLDPNGASCAQPASEPTTG